MVTERGDAPLDVIVIVAVEGFGDGELGESPPPHDTAASATSRTIVGDDRNLHIRKTSSKY
jgi:hypothetical protein